MSSVQETLGHPVPDERTGLISVYHKDKIEVNTDNIITTWVKYPAISNIDDFKKLLLLVAWQYYMTRRRCLTCNERQS